MSSDWPKIRLGDYVDSCLGKMLDKKKNKGIAQVYLGNSNVRWGEFELSELAEMKFEEHEYERYTIVSGDLIICEGGEPGRCAIWNEELPEMKIQKALHRVRAKNGLDNKYLFYWFLYAGKNSLLEPFFTGTTIKHLTGKALNNLQLSLPPKKHQDFVADTLGSLDQKIQVNKQINQTLEQMAQAIFKSWFVDFEPVKAKMAALEAGGSEEDALIAAMQAISGKDQGQLSRFKTEQPEQYNELRTTAELFPAAMQDSEIGEIPEGWEALPLDQIATYQNGLALQKFRPKQGEDSLPVVKIAQLKKGTADGEELASANIKRECIIENGDVVFSWSGSLIVDIWCGGKAALNQHLFKVTSDSVPKWMYLGFTKHHLAEFQRIAADKAVTMGHIKREHLNQAMCALPERKMLEGFDKYFEENLELQILRRLENETLIKVRDTLLPKLLSGEVTSMQQSREYNVHDSSEDERTFINQILNELPPLSSFLEKKINNKPSNRSVTNYYTFDVLGENGSEGVEYFKLPKFLNALHETKLLGKIMSASVESMVGVPFSMDAIMVVLRKFLGRKINFDQKTALVLLAFPKSVTRKTSELLDKVAELCKKANVEMITEEDLFLQLKKLQKEGLVLPLNNGGMWRLVHKFEHRINHWE